MNPMRYRPGGDKYQSTKYDDRRSFFERVQAEKDDILSALKSVVGNWAENEIDEGNNPTFENFRDEYPEWDVEELYATIGEELHRVKHGLSRTGEAV